MKFGLYFRPQSTLTHCDFEMEQHKTSACIDDDSLPFDSKTLPIHLLLSFTGEGRNFEISLKFAFASCNFEMKQQVLKFENCIGSRSTNDWPRPNSPVTRNFLVANITRKSLTIVTDLLRGSSDSVT